MWGPCSVCFLYSLFHSIFLVSFTFVCFLSILKYFLYIFCIFPIIMILYDFLSIFLSVSALLYDDRYKTESLFSVFCILFAYALIVFFFTFYLFLSASLSILFNLYLLPACFSVYLLSVFCTCIPCSIGSFTIVENTHSICIFLLWIATVFVVFVCCLFLLAMDFLFVWSPVVCMFSILLSIYFLFTLILIPTYFLSFFFCFLFQFVFRLILSVILPVLCLFSVSSLSYSHLFNVICVRFLSVFYEFVICIFLFHTFACISYASVLISFLVYFSYYLFWFLYSLSLRFSALGWLVS